MSKPKRGTHSETCLKMNPACKCNTCQNDCAFHCTKVPDAKPLEECPIEECPKYIKDEPRKKGAADV